MKHLMLVAMIATALAGTAQAQSRYDDRYGRHADENVNYAYADVLRADPVYGHGRSGPPREECYDERVRRHEPRGGDPTGGTIIGAIVGGALGNTVGKGDGRRAATVAGAVVGGAVGRNVDRNNGPGHSYEGTQTRCRIVDGGYEQREIVGYDVEYRYRGDVYMSRLDYNPGDRLRVRVSVTPAE